MTLAGPPYIAATSHVQELSNFGPRDDAGFANAGLIHAISDPSHTQEASNAILAGPSHPASVSELQGTKRPGRRGRFLCPPCRKRKKGNDCVKITELDRCSECINRGIDCGPRTWPPSRQANLQARNNRYSGIQTWHNGDHASTLPQDRESPDFANLFRRNLVQASQGVASVPSAYRVAQRQNLHPRSVGPDQTHPTSLFVKAEETFKAKGSINEPLSRTLDLSGPHPRNTTWCSNNTANVERILKKTFPNLPCERIHQIVESLAEENERCRTASRDHSNVEFQTCPQVTHPTWNSEPEQYNTAGVDLPNTSSGDLNFDDYVTIPPDNDSD